MATPLADMIARMRNDLHDNDATSYRWTDAVLQRHIERAIQDYTEEAPLEQKNTLTTTAGSRDVSLSTLTSLIKVERVEYPVDQYPPVYVRFRVWSTTLTLLDADEPSATNNLYVFWHKAHSISASATTIPTQHTNIVETGAAAYAALEWANYAINRVNVGGGAAIDQYKAWGEMALAQFRADLRKLGHRGRLRQSQIHPPL